MKKIFFLLLVIAFTISKSRACGNYYYALDKEGRLVPLGYSWKYPFNKNFNLELNVTKLKKLEAKLKKEKNYMLLSDYALCLMKLGKSEEALELLKELYKHYPNEYKIAANLGTAYELNGQVDSALKYIKRDLQLNPHDHEGSEWIHVKILETKLQLKKNPAYLNTHTVLSLTNAQKNDSVVLQHLSIQLQERVPFTPPASEPNELMANLLIDLAEMSANMKSIEYARAYYQIAKYYYGSKVAFLDDRIKEMEQLLRKYIAVKPVHQKYIEGERIRVGSFKYQELLKDNNSSNYIVNWEKLNTNVDALLALVDFTRTSQQVKESVNKDTLQQLKDELKLVPEDADHIPKPDSANKAHNISATDEKVLSEKQKDTAGNTTWLYILGSVFIIVGGYVAIKQLNKK